MPQSKRSSRWADAPGTRSTLTQRDLDLLYALFIHFYLTTEELRLVAAPDASQQVITRRTTKLKRSPNGLIEQPMHQREAFNANWRHLTFKLSRAGIDALVAADRVTAEQARWHLAIAKTRTAYHHDVMASHITASIAIGCRDKGLEFLSWLDILEGEDCPEATRQAPNPLSLGYRLHDEDRTLIPDALCGVQGDAGPAYFAIEADRHSEPIESHDLNRSSYARHIAGYRVALRQNLYEKRWGIPNMQVLSVTTSAVHMDNIVAYLKKATASPERGLAGPKPFLFKAIPELSRWINRPPATGHVLVSPWQRVDEKDVRLVA